MTMNLRLILPLWLMLDMLFCRVVSGFIIILTGITARHFNLNIQGNKHWLCIVNYELKSSTSRKLFHFQVNRGPILVSIES